MATIKGSEAARLAVEPTEQIAEAVAQISDAMRKLRAGRLNDKALLILLSHASGVSQREVRAVLDGMESLRGLYLKKPTA